jgi:Sulfotransferase domain
MAEGLGGVYRRVRYGKPIVVVSGLPRSGTSMAMKMLEAGGLATVTDGQRVADEDNPKGYYEDERVKRLHKEEDKTWLLEARGKVVKIISFLLKSLPDEHNYKVVFMHRNLREIVASQNKMLSRLGKPNDLPDAAAVQLLTTQEKEASFFLKRPQFEVLELNYTDVLGQARAQAQRMAEFVGEPLDIDKMAAVVDKELYRNRA